MADHRRDIIEAAGGSDGVAQMRADPDPRKKEMIRDHAPHPEELCGHLAADIEHIDQGKWKIEAADDGWYPDVVNGLWMEGYLIRGTDVSEAGNVIHTVIEERRLETGICPVCGERNEPNTAGPCITCPDCGAEL